MSSLAATQTTLIGTLWPTTKGFISLRTMILALLGSAFVAASAQVQVSLLPFSPVPITGQTFAVLVVGMAFGWRLGAATLLLYMAEGAIGIPVFAKLSGGLGVIAGATGGYIVGFVVAAAAVGYLAQRGWDRNVGLTALAMLIGNIAIYLPGLPWLAVWYAGPGAEYIAAAGTETAVGAALAAGAAPFLVGDALKLALAACVLPLAWKLVGRPRRS
ncbi:MAG: biotin transporter BioY [Proteobacteria bacterium]|nr:biotin transporter BioY [Pseudomonadota bacterium]